MRRSWPSAALLGFLACTSVSLAEEPAQPGCVYERMQLRLMELIESCKSALASNELSNETRSAALYARGRAYHGLMKLNLAFKDYTDALELAPNNAEIFASRSNIYYRWGESDLYVGDVKKAAKINPKNPKVLMTLGNFNLDARDPYKAIKFYSLALEINPANALALIFRMRVYENWLQDIPKALADADAAVRVSSQPDQPHQSPYFDDGAVRDIHVVALTSRARLLQATGEMERAQQDYDAAVARDRSGYALTKRAQFSKRGTVSSLADLQEAIQREPRNTTMLYTLGLRLMQEQHFGDALLAFDRSIEINPNDAWSLRMRARVYREFGRTEEAAQDLMHAVSVNEDILKQTIPALRMAGYWHSTQVPKQMTRGLEDALRACMIDPKCN